MARFLRHIRCENCGSSDANAIYDDGGSFCFSCHDKSRPTMSPLVAKAQRNREDVSDVKPLPDDLSTHFGSDAVAWLGKYHVPIETLIARGVRYSPSKNQLVFTFPWTGDKQFFQARNLSESDWRGRKLSKYFTSGPHEGLLPIYQMAVQPLEGPRQLVLTEDCLSAITLADSGALEGRRIDAMPLLGTNLPTSKLTRLAKLYRSLVVWLDHDKAKEAMKIAQRAKMLGMQARVVITEQDPKELTDEEISGLFFVSSQRA